MKFSFHSLVPPIVFQLKKRLTQRNRPLGLFGGDDLMFKQLAAAVKVYGEYGCGESTKWVVDNTDAKVISVDTAREWVEFVHLQSKVNAGRCTLQHIDVGPVGAWGYPISHNNVEGFELYTDFIWSMEGPEPELVLIDGRFRVCCFLTCLKYAPAGTQIIFDDYVSRPCYHYVERHVERKDECGDQCLFIVPAKDELNFEALDSDIRSFRHVME